MDQISVRIMQCRTARKGQISVDCIGVGVGVVLYDKVKKIGVGLHVLAPRSAVPSPPNPAKYADTGVAHALELLMNEGGLANPQVAVAGGAAMEGSNTGSSMGIKVVEAVKETLSKLKLPILKEETGGSKIRSILLDIDKGQISFK